MKFSSPKQVLSLSILAIFAIAACFLLYNLFFSEKNKNVVDSLTVSRGVGWKNNRSLYSGSELSLSFNNSREVSFEFNTSSKADQGVEISLDGKNYYMSSPNLGNQKLTIYVDKKKPHTVVVRHICTFLFHPCDITVKGIYLERDTKLNPYQARDKTLSILGDSISTIYGRDNYSQLLATDIGYELHNASILESTVSEVKGVDNAIKRYKKDLMSFESDVIIIFLGTNDVKANVPIDVFSKDYLKIVSDIKGANPNGKIFLVGTLSRKDLDDSVLQNYNAVIKNIAEKQSVYFIDAINWLAEGDFSDDIHPSRESQKKIAEYFKEHILPVLK